MSEATGRAAISREVVEATITAFTDLDESGDKRSMTKMARRLGKEQPALLQYAAKFRTDHGDTVGEAAVFYSTLVWAMFDRNEGRAPRLTPENITGAESVVAEELEKIEGLEDEPVQEQVAVAVQERQPHVYAKLKDLIEEDVREAAMTADCAKTIYRPTQVVVEAFDAAIEGRRPGLRLGPIVRDTPKVGRNEKCPCGSGAKFKKCCGAN